MSVVKIQHAIKQCLHNSKAELGNKRHSLTSLLSSPNSAYPDSVIAKASLAEKLKEALLLLNEREEEIIRLRFGIDRQSTYTLDEIGKRFNLTRERIRQIEKAALGKLANSNIKDHLESFLKSQ